MEEIPFQQLGVEDDILKSLRKMHFDSPTEVQALTITPFLEGEDMLVQAPTGTGKTAAFGVPIIQKIDPEQRCAQALILSPTRELALQITGVLRDLADSKPGIRIATLYGGEAIAKQFTALRKFPQIIVATPGRLLDHMHRKTIKLNDLRIVVLDEADRMLDMGFRDDLHRILSVTPKDRQTVLFSATIPQEIILIASRYQKNVQEVHVEQKSLAVETVKHYYAAVYPGWKPAALVELLQVKKFPLSLVFVNTKYMADSLAAQLQQRGIRAEALHGDMKQSQRDKVMKQYRTGELETLVATDVAARGIDVKNIDAVINYDIPMDDDSYVHRIGRTGRATQEGEAYTLLTPEEADRLRQLAKHLRIEIEPLAGTEPLPDEKAQAAGSTSSPAARSFSRRGRSARLTLRKR